MTDALIPDDRDWTWVLEHPCPECGFVAAEFESSSAGEALRQNAAAWSDLLTGDRDALTERRRQNRWSDLEYAAHVRDVHRLYFDRLEMMLTETNPLYPNWDQDASAIEASYNTQDPAMVSEELLSAAARLAAAFDSVAGDQWSRPGRRSDGASFTVDSFARYLVHDPVHHLWDVSGKRVDAR